ncbi:MAG: histidine triad nucleotide-binding protein [Candidatus Latescibacteria bacterium]|nr:histidine triad nucleotide-binding protein [Candidatus Latescibacterota bacterium]
MADCLFCKIAAGEIPVERIYENNDVLAFPDINPVAPVHILIIPKKHYATSIDLSEEAPELCAAMLKASTEVARFQGIDKSGFRLILNTNADGGQEIFHMHMHLLGGEYIGRLRGR